MSFSKVGPGGGWAFGSKLTSAQMNQLDADHANALDKSVANDTLLGTITLAANAAIRVVSSPSQITTAAVGGIASLAASGIQGTVQDAIVPTTARGISDGGVDGGIAATTARGIKSLVPGGFSLSGGNTDYPTWPGTRSLFRARPLRVSSGGLASGGWSNDGLAVRGGASNVVQFFDLDVIEGASLQVVYFSFWVTSHSNVPVNLPRFSVQMLPTAANQTPVVPGVNSGAPLNSGDSGAGLAFATPGTGATWTNSNLLQVFAYTCNQNQVIATSANYYTLMITDENGSNSLPGNAYVAYTAFWSVGQLNYA